ncbi:MAG: hypothetical protein CMF35_16435 [Leeuwenhoekiella sp.]|nr:hypothetical protein [Leeuwenhoekiella sp.]
MPSMIDMEKAPFRSFQKGLIKKHEMKRQFLTKRATTRWSDIPIVKC